jgi:ABC-type lipoprotein release transport system permease subunit
MASAELRYATRSLVRNVRRTSLSIAGIAIGCWLLNVTESFNRGKDGIFAAAGAESGTGHLRIVPAGWEKTRDLRLRLAHPERDLAAARALPGVRVAAPRLRTQAILAEGTHVVAVELVGVDPEAERIAYRYARRVTRGRWLAPGAKREIVVGQAIADRLGVGIDDQLLTTAVGRGGRIEAAMLTVVGIVATGTEEIDLGISHVAIPDVEALTGVDGLGEVTLLLQDWRRAGEAADALQQTLGAPDRVLDWKRIAPDFVAHMKQDTAASRVINGIILLVVLIGVASAQLSAVLERRREFAVLAALGMGGPRLVRVVLVEGLALGLAGSVAALVISLPAAWALTRYGFDFSRFLGGSYAFAGTVMDPVVHGDLGPWLPVQTLIVAVAATVLASLYPAWFAARTDPAQALRLAQ